LKKGCFFQPEIRRMNVYVFRGNLDLSFIRVLPGQWVVLKPNLIKQSKETDANEWRSVITSPEIIEEVCDDVCRKLAGRGKSDHL